MMSRAGDLIIFGEVLFDCFPGGERILGGAPFNVAWHAQALGDRPQLISRVGTDQLGDRILAAMERWGMECAGIQRDPVHQTGRVAVEVVDNEPSYDILPDCAYDYIAPAPIAPLPGGILYHGTLGLRNSTARDAFSRLAQNPALAIFLDVNLRSPWWHRDEVFLWLKRARWVKLNLDELRALGFGATDIRRELASFQDRFQLEQVILTRGAAGALVRTSGGEFHRIAPERALAVVDSVGAGDAFSAVYLHGLRAGWSIGATLELAQRFAGKILGLRGATTSEVAFYRDLGG